VSSCNFYREKNESGGLRTKKNPRTTTGSNTGKEKTAHRGFTGNHHQRNAKKDPVEGRALEGSAVAKTGAQKKKKRCCFGWGKGINLEELTEAAEKSDDWMDAGKKTLPASGRGGEKTAEEE